MKSTALALITMLASPTLPALAQAPPDLAFYGTHGCAVGAAQAQTDPEDGETLCLDPKPLFGGTAITAVSPDVDKETGKDTAIVTLGQNASTLMYAFTYSNAGHKMGVVLDGKLVSAPFISRPNGAGQVTVFGLSHAQIAALIARYQAKTP
jgi:preprotein translocase subunit SecD